MNLAVYLLASVWACSPVLAAKFDEVRDAVFDS